MFIVIVFDIVLIVALPITVKLGVGGFSMGAATSLYSATCFTHGKYGNGNLYPANLSAVVGLSGWLPCSKLVSYIGTFSYELDAFSLSPPFYLVYCYKFYSFPGL